MKDILERVITLIKKTGDKVIVVKEEEQASYVVMDFNEYEEMVLGRNERGLTGGETADKMDKINRDIALWREELEKGEEAPSGLPVDGQIDEKETESQFYFEPVE